MLVPQKCPIGGQVHSCRTLLGYPRVSTSGQDVAAQRDVLQTLGVDDDHVHVDHGLSATTRARPYLREALAACRTGDVLVVTDLDRLACSLRNATAIANELKKLADARRVTRLTSALYQTAATSP